MKKKYIVRLMDEECKVCNTRIDRLQGSSETARRARILPQVDADGPHWTDRQVAETFRCHTRTVENVRGLRVLEGFPLAPKGRPSERPRRYRHCLTGIRRAA